MVSAFLLLFSLVSGVCAQESSKENEALLQKWITSVSERRQLLTKASTLEKKQNEYTRLVQEKQEKILQNRKKLSHCFHLLVRLGRINPLRFLVDLKSTQYSIRGIILTRTVGSALASHMKQMQADINELQALQTDLDTQEHTYQDMLQTIELQKDTLKTEGAQVVEEIQQKEEERLRSETNIQALLEESQSTLSKKSKETRKKPPHKNFPFDRLTLPVTGDLLDNAAMQKKFSPGGKGAIFKTQKGAEVCAAAKGVVVFKGPFRSHGDILILDHGKHVHTVYIGMDNINIEMNQSVYAGEKIGTIANYGKKEPLLYIELRHKGKPVEILPYFPQ